MNVAFIIGANFKLGGQMKSCISLAKELEKLGHSILMIGYGYNNEVLKILDGCALDIVYWKPYNEYIIENDEHENFFEYNRISLREILISNNIDFVHLQDYESAKDGLWAISKLRLPYILTIPGGPNYGSKLLTRRIPVILYSKEQVDFYKSKNFFLRPRIFHLQARIDESYFKREKQLYRQRFTNESFKFFLALRLNLDKRPFIISAIKLIERLNEYFKASLFIAGEGELESEILTYATDNKLTSTINLIGPKHSDTELQDSFTKYDINIGNGRIIMESMAMRIPVICLGENDEFALVTCENIGMISNFNFSGRHFRGSTFNYAQELVGLQDQLKDLEEITANNFNYALTHFHAGIGAMHLSEIYKDVSESRNKYSYGVINFMFWYALKKFHFFLFRN